MRKLSKIIALLLFVTTCVFANWTGSSSEPANMKKIDGKAFYVITSADELAWFATKVNSGKTDINAVLGNDIVFGKDKNTTGTVNWTPIGKTTDRQFAGILDGAGYTVYGLYVSGWTNAGLVGVLAETGIVKNVIMTMGNISVDPVNLGTISVGAIAAISYGTILNSVNQNTVILNTATSYLGPYLGVGDYIYAGGLVGSNKGTISNCHNSGLVSAKINASKPQTRNFYFGGVAGENVGKIHDCYNLGQITSRDTISCNFSSNQKVASYSGGIVGSNLGEISNCYNKGWVNSEVIVSFGIYDGSTVTSHAEAYSGGIVGINSGKIFRCYNAYEGYVYSKSEASAYSQPKTCDYAGGTGSASTKAISYSYSGGIGGYNQGNIYDCYSERGGISTAEAKSHYYKYVSGDGYAAGCRSLDAKKETYQYSGGIVGQNASKGTTKTSYYRTTEYWLNNTKVTGSIENMKKDQFAWILNTCNGTEKNSGAWTRSSDGYPTFANEDSLAIYKIVFNDDGISSVRYTNYQGLVSFPDNPEPAEGYIFSGWFNSEDVKVKPSTIWTADETVNAAYTDVSDVYWTINFINADGTLLETKLLQHGSIVEYKGDEPSLASTAQYDYTFKGWDVEPTNATEDFDYHAVYDSTIRSYMIIFKDYDGSVIQSSSFLYGKTPTCMIVPKRSSTEEFNYSHSGWTPAVEKVTGEATYTAIYEATKVKYTVTFMNGTTVIEEQSVDYGSAAVAPSAPTRDGYKFVGWNVSFANVTKNLTVKALFEELIYHTVVVVIDKEKNSKNVEENDIFELPVAPEKDGYTFEGWYDADGKFIGNSGEKITITENLTIEARYAIISYTVTFVDDNGSEISSAKVDYGMLPMAPKDPTKASTDQYTYTFVGWDKEITKVTSDVTYTAIYDKFVRKYTVSFFDFDGTVLDEQSVAYGSSAKNPKDPSRSGYKFIGWDTDYTDIVKETKVTALYEKFSSSSSAKSSSSSAKSSSSLAMSSSSFVKSSSSSVISSSSSVKSSSSSAKLSSSSAKSSSSIAKSSSSSAKSSSSSVKKTDAIIASNFPIFRVSVVGRNVQIANAKIGSKFIAFDMQGRIILTQIVDAANFAVSLPQAGNYIISIDNVRKVVQVK